MSKYRHTSKKIKELEEENKILNKSRDFLASINETLHNNYDVVNEERLHYKRLIKYHTLLLMLMNLLTSDGGDTEIDRIFKRNINEYYRLMNEDLTKVSNDDDEILNDEFEDEEEGYDEGEGSDIWDAQKEFE